MDKKLDFTHRTTFRESVLQPVQCIELDITESLGPIVPVLNNLDRLELQRRWLSI